MPLWLISAVLLLEGFSTVAIELIAIRQLIPAVGSNIVVTSWTIGLFLLALALGYWKGGTVSRGTDVEALNRRLAISYSLSAAWLGIGLSLPFILQFFMLPVYWQLALLIYVITVLIVPVIALGQTVPVLAAIAGLSGERGTGELTGGALFLSTLGSVASALLLPTLLFQTIGVQMTLVLVCALLVLVAILFASRMKGLLARRNILVPVLLVVALVAALANIKVSHHLIGDTAYALYQVVPATEPGLEREMLVNTQRASGIGKDGRQAFPYIMMIRGSLNRLKPYARVLVIGAGGFTLSADGPEMKYTYVDIDPAILHLAEEYLLKRKITGDFVVDDGRHFLANSKDRYDGIVLDAFTSHRDAPAHMSSIEFFSLVQEHLKPNGLMVLNLVVDPQLDSVYAQRTLATIERVFGQCDIVMTSPWQRMTNAIITCSKPERIVTEPYRDDTTTSQTDFLDLSRSQPKPR